MSIKALECPADHDAVAKLEEIVVVHGEAIDIHAAAEPCTVEAEIERPEWSGAKYRTSKESDHVHRDHVPDPMQKTACIYRDTQWSGASSRRRRSSRRQRHHRTRECRRHRRGDRSTMQRGRTEPGSQVLATEADTTYVGAPVRKIGQNEDLAGVVITVQN